MILNGYITSCTWILGSLVIWSLSEGSGPSSHGPRSKCWTVLLFKILSAPPWRDLYSPNHWLQGWPYVFRYPLSGGKLHNSTLLHLRVIMWLALVSEMLGDMVRVVFELLPWEPACDSLFVSFPSATKPAMFRAEAVPSTRVLECRWHGAETVDPYRTSKMSKN